MTIESEKDLAALRRIGRVVALALRSMGEALEPGITTAELDAIGARILDDHGARSAPQVTYDFPAATCISINQVIAHGIPGDGVVQPGDLVNIDVSAELDGYYADTAASFAVPPVGAVQSRLVNATRRAQKAGMRAARAGHALNAIGKAVEREAARAGFEVIRNLPGHGIGHSLHEPPTVLNFYDQHLRQPLPEGLVITVEPFLSVGARAVTEGRDGWALITSDGGLAAQFEHTIVVTRGKPIILTRAG